MTEKDTTADSWPAMDDITGADDTPGTGDARVDAAVARLGELTDAPLDEHPVILGEVHDRLREVLDELGPAAGPSAPSPSAAASGTAATPVPPGTPVPPATPGSRGTP